MYQDIAPRDRACRAALPQSAAVTEGATLLRILPSVGTLTATPVVAIQVLGSTPLPNQERYIQLGYLTEHYPALERIGAYSGGNLAGQGTDCDAHGGYAWRTGAPEPSHRVHQTHGGGPAHLLATSECVVAADCCPRHS